MNIYIYIFFIFIFFIHPLSPSGPGASGYINKLHLWREHNFNLWPLVVALISIDKSFFFAAASLISSVKFKLHGPQMFPLSLFRQLVGY